MTLKSRFFAATYKNVLKPVFFKFDPENVHDFFTLIGKALGKFSVSRAIVRKSLAYANPILKQNIAGINFPNPIGLAAGFDKDANLVDILPEVGFGFLEIGSITGEPCQGNPRPRLWRLPKSNALVINYGLKNDGCEVLSQKLHGKKFKIPLGISAAKTNSQETAERVAGIQDYKKVVEHFQGIGNYLTLNLSCPNAFGGQPFCNKTALAELLHNLKPLLPEKPVFLKLSPDLDQPELDDIIKLALEYKLTGLICSNLSKSRTGKIIKDKIVPEVGGLSGQLSKDLANQQISYCYRQAKGRLVIIGCGGIFSAEEAYEKILLGASLLQMITGMIFQGPQIVGDINRGLVELLQKDGYDSISEAIGQKNR